MSLKFFNLLTLLFEVEFNFNSKQICNKLPKLQKNEWKLNNYFQRQGILSSLIQSLQHCIIMRDKRFFIIFYLIDS